MEEAPRLFGGTDALAASAALSNYVSARALSAHVFMQGSDTRPPVMAADGVVALGIEIHAAGDLAGGDHWEAAAHQGRATARAILGLDPAAPQLTSWWSDVHDLRLQGLGSPLGADDLIFDGDRDARSFTAVALRGGTPVAALAVDRPRELPRLRRLLSPDNQMDKEAA